MTDIARSARIYREALESIVRLSQHELAKFKEDARHSRQQMAAAHTGILTIAEFAHKQVELKEGACSSSTISQDNMTTTATSAATISDGGSREPRLAGSSSGPTTPS